MRARRVFYTLIVPAILACGTVSAETATITVMGTGGSGDSDNWPRVFKAFMATHPDIAISYLKVDGGKTFEKTVVLSAAGTPPDVVLNLNSEYALLAGKGLLLDIGGFVDSSYLQDLYQGPVDFSYYQGHLYGLPIDTGTEGIYYNEGMFSDAGIGAIPQDYDWADFLTYARKTTKTDGQGQTTQWGFSLYQYLRDYMNFVWTDDGTIFNADRTKFTLNSPQAIEALQFVADLALVHHVSPTPDVYGKTAAWTFWYNDQAAMYVCGSWCLSGSRQRNKFQWDITTFPTRKQYTIVNEPNIVSVTSGSKEPQAAVTFVKWLAHDDEAQKLLSANGEGIPENKAVANRYFPDPSTPQHEEVFLAMLNSGLPRIMPYDVPDWSEISDDISDKMHAVFDGSESARQAMSELEPVIEGILHR